MKRLAAFFIFSALIVIAATPAAADYKQAVAYYKQGRFDKAIQEIKPDLDKNPDWEFGHRFVGLCYLNLRNNALAISSFRRAVQLESKSFPTYQGLGQAYYNLQRFEDCLAALDQGEEFAKESQDQYNLHHLRGSAYYRQERFEETVRELTAAIRIKASDWTDYSQLGVAYYQLSRYQEAGDALLKALALKPRHNVTMEYLSKTFFQQGIEALSNKQYDDALESLNKAKEYNSQDGFIHYNLAEAYLFQENYEEAERALNQALDLMPRSAEVFQRLGLIYEKGKKWDLSLNAYQKANELNPSPALEEAIARVTELKKRGNS
jgi:tetratricopeptide (TPR) repeat protein